jgi:hypothetical protein
MRPLQLLEPRIVSRCPIPPRKDQPSAQQEFAEAVATPHEIGPGILTGTTEIANRFVGQCRGMYFREQTGAQPLRQLPRIAPIGLHAISGLAWH